MNRYIIFDMDGVVIDSEGWYLNLLRNFLSNNNFNIPDKVLMETIGLDMIHVSLIHRTCARYAFLFRVAL